MNNYKVKNKHKDLQVELNLVLLGLAYSIKQVVSDFILMNHVLCMSLKTKLVPVNTERTCMKTRWLNTLKELGRDNVIYG